MKIQFTKNTKKMQLKFALGIARAYPYDIYI